MRLAAHCAFWVSFAGLVALGPGCSPELRVLRSVEATECDALTCEGLGAACGELAIGCGETPILRCGSCGQGETCNATNQCEADAAPGPRCLPGFRVLRTSGTFCDEVRELEVVDGVLLGHTSFPGASTPGRSHLLQLGDCPTPVEELAETTSDADGGSDVIAAGPGAGYLTSRRGGGLHRYAAPDFDEVELLPPESLENPCALSYVPDEDALYVLTCGDAVGDGAALFRFPLPAGPLETLGTVPRPSPRRMALAEGALHWGTRDATLHRWTLATQTADEVPGIESRVRALGADPEGVLWLATEAGTLFSLDGRGLLARADVGEVAPRKLAFAGDAVFAGGAGGVARLQDGRLERLDIRPVVALLAHEGVLFGTTTSLGGSGRECSAVRTVWARDLDEG